MSYAHGFARYSQEYIIAKDEAGCAPRVNANYAAGAIKLKRLALWIDCFDSVSLLEYVAGPQREILVPPHLSIERIVSAARA